MDRRRVLRAAGTLAVGLTAGCLTADEPSFDLRVVHKDFDAGPEGNLTVRVTVSNPGNERQSGTVYVTAQINDDSTARIRRVTLDAHETTEIEISYDVAFDDLHTFEMDASVEPAESDTE